MKKTFLRVVLLLAAGFVVIPCAAVDCELFGDGVDGEVTVGLNDTAYTDSVRSAVTGDNLVGAMGITVADAAGFSVGDEILVITMQDPETEAGLNQAGRYETHRIASVVGTDLNLAGALQNSYATSGGMKHQVLRVPNYTDVTVDGVLTCADWDGTTGGVLFFRANGTVTVNRGGEVTATGKGFRGGLGNFADDTGGGSGEGITGNYNIHEGGYVLNGAGQGYGGGGGGNGTAGTAGARSSNRGRAAGDEDLTRLLSGGGGGGGHDNDSNRNSVDQGRGGDGGGVIFIAADTIDADRILSHGTRGTSPYYYKDYQWSDGAGGGGAGGSIRLICRALAAGKIGACGAQGAYSYGTSGDGFYSNGGMGGEGRIRVDCPAATLADVFPQPYSVAGIPNILHTPPANNPDPGSQTPVSALVYDDEGDAIASVSVWYRVDGGVFSELVLSSSDGTEYTGNIPAQSVSSLIEYYIVAQDGGRSDYSSPADAPTELYSFRIAGGPPRALSATAGDGAEVDLAWSAPADTAGLVDYTVYRSTDADFTPAPEDELQDLPGLTFTDTVPLVQDSLTYYYRVGANYNLSRASSSTAGPPVAVAMNDPGVTTVRGHALLENGVDHSGITVSLTHTSPAGQDYATVTDASGAFELIIMNGIYNVVFSKTGYQSNDLFTSQTYVEDADLESVTLNELGVSVPGGEVSGNWDQPVYSIEGDITVPEGATLTIAPGTQIRFLGDYGLTVNGRLEAIGTSQAEIVFTSLLPSHLKKAGQWQGIDFTDASDDTSVISHALIECAVDGVYWNGANAEVNHSEIRYCFDKGLQVNGDSSNPVISDVRSHLNCSQGVHIDNGQPTLSTVRSHHNFSYGLYCRNDAEPTVADSRFDWNTSYGIRCYDWGNGLFSGCEISHNSSWGVRVDYSNVLFEDTRISRNSGYGVGYNDSNNTWASPRFDRCTILGNTSHGFWMRYRAENDGYIRNSTIRGNGSCGIRLNRQCHLTISGNDINGNGSHGIRIDTDYNSSPSNPTVTGNLIWANGADGIYRYDTASPTITYNTIYGNSGDGIEVNSGGTETVRCNIIAGNEQYGVRSNAAVETFDYNDVHGNTSGEISDTGNLPAGAWVFSRAATDPYGNFSLDPLFADAAGDDFSLQATSLCIDAGDPAVQDPDNTISDVGALYRDHGNPHWLSVEDYSEATVSLSWSAVENEVNGTLSEYRIYYRKVEEPPASWSLFDQIVPPQTTVDVTGLDNNVLYEFVVTGYYDPAARQTYESTHSPTVTEKPGVPLVELSPGALETTVAVSGHVENVTVTNNGTRDLEVELPGARTAFGSAVFDGSGDYVEVPDSPALDLEGNQMSIEAWIYIENYSGDSRCIAAKIGWGSAGSWSYKLQINDTGTLRYRFYNTGNSYYRLDSPGGVGDRAWHHVAATYDGSAIRLYIDGIQVADKSASGNIRQSSYALRIGAYESSNPNYFHGNIGELRIWNVARTGEQIRGHMYMPVAGDETGLAAYFPLNQDLADWSVNGAQGTATGDAQIAGTKAPLSAYPIVDNGTFVVAPGASPDMQLTFPFSSDLPGNIYGYTIPIMTNVTGSESLLCEVQANYGTAPASEPLQHFSAVGSTGVGYEILIRAATIDGAPIAADDEIGIFDGDTCVGAFRFDGAFVGTIPITVWQSPGRRATDGFTPGSDITVKMYDASEDLETVTTPTFEIGTGEFGYNEFSALSITGTVYRTLSIPVSGSTFNAVSFNKRPDNADVGVVFGVLENLEVVQDDTGAVYIPKYGINTLGDIDIRRGYHVFCSDATPNLDLTGKPIPRTDLIGDPAYAITLAPNRWNLIPFLGENLQDVSAAFDAIEGAIELVQRCSDGGFWIPGETGNGLVNLEPGLAYRVALKAGSGQQTFNYTITGAARARDAEDGSRAPSVFQPVAPTGLPYTILISSALIDGQALAPGAEVAVFDGAVCVGAAVSNGSESMQITAWEGVPGYDLAGFTRGNPIRFEVAVEIDDGLNVLTPSAHFVRGSGTFGDAYYTIAGLTTGDLPTVEAVEVVDPTESAPGVTNQRLVELYIQEDGSQSAWLVSESADRPAADDPRWSVVRPTSYEIQGDEGEVIIHVWVKDAEGRISLLHAGSQSRIILDLGLRFAVHLSNANVESLTFGQWNYATVDYDKNLDQSASTSRSGVLPDAYLRNDVVTDPALRELVADFRPVESLSRWRLHVNLPDGRGSTDLLFEIPPIPAGKCMLLQKLADGENPVGPPLEVLDGLSITVSENSEYELVLGIPQEEALELMAGWTLVSLPSMNTVPLERLFPDVRDGTVGQAETWRWSDGQFVPFDEALPLNAETGYWLYSSCAQNSRTFSGIRADGIVTLKPGWNLVGPVGACLPPAAESILCTWAWDTARGVYQAVSGNEELLPGQGYWIFALQETAVFLSDEQ